MKLLYGLLAVPVACLLRNGRRVGLSPARVIAKDMPRPVVWIHLHKVAGTSICDTAQLNNEVVVSPKDNCNWKPYDQAQNHHPAAVSCDARRQEWLGSRATWFQIEHEVRDEDLCPDTFHYATMLRDPVALSESMTNYQPRDWKGFGDVPYKQYGVYIDCFEAGAETCPPLAKPHVLALWIYFDNPMVRTLGGPDVMNLPPRGVNSTHVQMVVDRLRKFDAVFFLETIDSTKERARLSDAFGWTNFQALDLHVNSQNKTISFSADEKARIRVLNEHDCAVYNHFKMLPSNDPVGFI